MVERTVAFQENGSIVEMAKAYGIWVPIDRLSASLPNGYVPSADAPLTVTITDPSGNII